MSTVAQDVQQIREAIYGREVREAIADGIEHCYSDVSGGVTTANTAAAAADAAAQRAITAAAGAEGIPGTASLADVNELKDALTPNHGLAILKKFAAKQSYSDVFTLTMNGAELVVTALKNVTSGNGGVDTPLTVVDLHSIDFDYKCNSDTCYQILIIAGYVNVGFQTVFVAKNTDGNYRHQHIDLTGVVSALQNISQTHTLKIAIWHLRPLYAGDTLYIKNFQVNAFDLVNPFQRQVVSPIIGEITEDAVRQWGSTATYTIINDSIRYTAPSDGNNGFAIVPYTRENITKIRVSYKFAAPMSSGTGLTLHIWDGISSDFGSHIYQIAIIKDDGYVDVDLAYISVYSPTIDINNWRLLVSNSGHNFVTTVTIKIHDCVGINSDWEGKTGLQVLGEISGKLDTIPPPTEVTYMVSPSGKKVITQITDNGDIVGTPIVPLKQLFLGNSLLAGFGFGMAASNKNRDYYHYITEYIKALEPSYTSNKLASSAFEGCTTVSAAESWMQNTLLPYLDSDIDLVTIQLGDNVNTDAKLAVFTTTSLRLMQFVRRNCPKARVVWIGSWYAQSLHAIIQENARQTGCEFIDFYDLKSGDNSAYIGKVYDLDEVGTRTFTVDSYTVDASARKLTITQTINGTAYTSVLPYESYTVSGSTLTVQSRYNIITNSGVANHPGDKGFAKIANRVLYKLGIAPSEDVIPIPDNR